MFAVTRRISRSLQMKRDARVVVTVYSNDAVTVYLFIMSSMIFLVSLNLTDYVQSILCVDSLVDILLHQSGTFSWSGFLTAVLIVLFSILSVCLSVSTRYCVNKDKGCLCAREGVCRKTIRRRLLSRCVSNTKASTDAWRTDTTATSSATTSR